MGSTFLKRVIIKDYKSIAACDVELGPLTFLVGPNGAGKSNFLDALRFTADSLRTSIDHAIAERGGINAIRRRTGQRTNSIELHLEFELPTGEAGQYSFRLGVLARGGFAVQSEACELLGQDRERKHFEIRLGKVVSCSEPGPTASRDRLYLVSASGLPAFRPVYEALSRMAFYALNLDRIRDYQPIEAGHLLARDGGNITAVLAGMARHAPHVKARIEAYLSSVTPAVEGVDVKRMGTQQTLSFRQRTAGAHSAWHFPASLMSEGTVRALGILVALFQAGAGNGARAPLVAFEEPEAALHPAATAVLRDGLRESSRLTQILVTSHSPELLDDEEMSPDSILAVSLEDGVTNVARLGHVGREALRQRLYTPGELLRMNQLFPDPAGGVVEG